MSETTKDEIYIDCQPVNSEGNVLIKEKNIIDVDAINQEISDDLFSKLVKNAECKVIILLDSDAYSDALKLYKKLNSTKLHDRVYIIKLPKGYDISDVNQKLGSKGVLSVLSSAKKIKESLI